MGHYLLGSSARLALTVLLLAAFAVAAPACVAGTANAAHVCGMDDRLGTVAAGRIADLLIVAESPLEDLAHLQEPLLVIHNGVIAVDHR